MHEQRRPVFGGTNHRRRHNLRVVQGQRRGLLDRGYRLTDRPPLAAVPGCDVPWEPDAGDLAVSLDRLRNKLHNPPRPGFYTFRGAPVGLDFYDMEAA